MHRRALRRRRRARDAGYPHQHADEGPLRRTLQHTRGLRRDAQRRHRAGGAEAGLRRRERRPRPAVAPRDRAAGAGRSLLPRRTAAGRRGAEARRALPDPPFVQGRPRAQQRYRADAGHGRAVRGAPRDARGSRRPLRGDDDRRLRRSPTCLRCARARIASAPRPGGQCGEPAGPARQLDALRHRLPPRATREALAAVELAERLARRAELRYRLGLGAGRPAPWPRALLPALQALPWRQEAPAAGQLQPALRAAGARRGARCAGPAAAGRRCRAQRRDRQPADIPGTRWREAHRGPGGLRRSLPWHADRSGDELRQGRDPRAGLDLGAPPQQAGGPGHERWPPGLPERQRGRHGFGLHDRAVHGGGHRQRPRLARASGHGVLHTHQRQRRGPRLDGRERGAPRARHERRPRQGARTGAHDRGAGAGFPP